MAEVGISLTTHQSGFWVLLATQTQLSHCHSYLSLEKYKVLPHMELKLSPVPHKHQDPRALSVFTCWPHLMVVWGISALSTAPLSEYITPGTFSFPIQDI